MFFQLVCHSKVVDVGSYKARVSVAKLFFLGFFCIYTETRTEIL